MKLNKFACLGLAAIVALGAMGCGSDKKEAYIPTGDALVMEGEEPPSMEDNAAPQELTLAYYADRSMNPIQSTDYTNRALFSLI